MRFSATPPALSDTRNTVTPGLSTGQLQRTKVLHCAVARLGRHIAFQAADVETCALQSKCDEVQKVDKLAEHKALYRAVR